METVKDFYFAAIFYDYKNIGIIEELKQTCKCLINNFHETTPVTRILLTLSITAIVILENHDIDIENVIENIHDLRANLLYMIRFEKVVKDDVDKILN